VTAALDARLVARRGALDLDVDITVADGEVVALVGPNASGKSTVLQLVAGLLSSRDGWVVVRGTTYAGRPPGHTGSRPVRPAPPYARGVGYLGQDPHVFGHMTVRRNVAYGARGPRDQVRARTTMLLAELDLVDLADRRADQLSGGEQARLALARALAPEPHLLLLDEPLTALDVRAAADIRTRLAHALSARNLPAVLVTHDVLDVAALAARVIVLDEGHVVDEGPVRRVLGEPRTAFAAALAAVSLVAGSVVDDRFVADSGWQLPVQTDARGTVWLAVPSDAVSLHPAAWPDRTGDAWTWETTVTCVKEAADGLRAEVAACPGLAPPVARTLVVDRVVAPDAPVRVRVDPDRVRVYPRT